MKKVFKKWKIWSDAWNKILVEKGLTRTWPWWIIHRRRASGSLGNDEPYVIEKGKWMFNSRNQTYYEESYTTKYQSLFNQEMKWLGYQKWKLIIWCEVLQVTTLKSQCLSKIKCDNPYEVKKRWSGKTQDWCKLKFKELILYLILSISWCSIKRDATWIANKVSMLT
jgi:hypothetical protein